MQLKSSHKFGSIMGALVLAALGFSAHPGAALAYPTGQNLTLLVAKTDILTPGTKATVSVKNVRPGCSVFVGFLDGASELLDAGNNGLTPSIELRTPSIAGAYTLSATTTGGCAKSETSKVTVYVGKRSTSTASISASGKSAAANPKLTVSGTLKFGSTPIKGVKVSVTVTGPKGKTSLKATTNAAGKFTLTVTGKARTAGSYTASVAYAGNA